MPQQMTSMVYFLLANVARTPITEFLRVLRGMPYQGQKYGINDDEPQPLRGSPLDMRSPWVPSGSEWMEIYLQNYNWGPSAQVISPRDFLVRWRELSIGDSRDKNQLRALGIMNESRIHFVHVVLMVFYGPISQDLNPFCDEFSKRLLFSQDFTVMGNETTGIRPIADHGIAYAIFNNNEALDKSHWNGEVSMLSIYRP